LEPTALDQQQRDEIALLKQAAPHALADANEDERRETWLSAVRGVVRLASGGVKIGLPILAPQQDTLHQCLFCGGALPPRQDNPIPRAQREELLCMYDQLHEN